MNLFPKAASGLSEELMQVDLNIQDASKCEVEDIKKKKQKLNPLLQICAGQPKDNNNNVKDACFVIINSLRFQI